MLGKTASVEQPIAQLNLKKQLTGASFFSEGLTQLETSEDCLCLDVDISDLLSSRTESTVEGQHEENLEVGKSSAGTSETKM